MSNIILNPVEHQFGVRRFFTHFDLRPQKIDLVNLQLILEKFAEIPYENISKIIKLSSHWDSNNKFRLPEEVIEEHIDHRLGGTCFSLTFFLQSILTQSGYICYPVMAHMRAGQNIHCSLVVILDHIKYLVDPGYLLNQPMAINPMIKRIYHHESGGVELQYDTPSGYYNLFTFNREEIKWRYQFQDRPCPPEEFMQHWSDSFTKSMMHGICLTRTTKKGLIYIHNDYLREVSYQDTKSQKIKNSLHSTVQTYFGIDQKLIESAQSAIEFNKTKEIELGIFVPKKKFGA
ncbi:arylamine N-acetyltransferase [candidate division KSB1 bacterium]|nr:arylamine N-acetyltransferase [candidate division KSB1 bacterium]